MSNKLVAEREKLNQFSQKMLRTRKEFLSNLEKQSADKRQDTLSKLVNVSEKLLNTTKKYSKLQKINHLQKENMQKKKEKIWEIIES